VPKLKMGVTSSRKEATDLRKAVENWLQTRCQMFELLQNRAVISERKSVLCLALRPIANPDEHHLHNHRSDLTRYNRLVRILPTAANMSGEITAASAFGIWVNAQAGPWDSTSNPSRSEKPSVLARERADVVREALPAWSKQTHRHAHRDALRGASDGEPCFG
jgi:hypothetical protein